MKKCRKLAAAVLTLALAAPCLSPLAAEEPKLTRITTEYTDGTRDREEYGYDQHGNAVREYRIDSDGSTTEERSFYGEDGELEKKTISSYSSDTGIRTEETLWSEANGDGQISRSSATVTKPDGQQTVTELWLDGINPIKKVISSGSSRITEEYSYDEDGDQTRLTRTDEAGTLLYEQTTAYPDGQTVETTARDYLGTVLQSSLRMGEDYSIAMSEEIVRTDGTRREFSFSLPSIFSLLSLSLEETGEGGQAGMAEQTGFSGENGGILSGLLLRCSVTGGDGTEASFQISGTDEGDLLCSILTSGGLNLSARIGQDGTLTVQSAAPGGIIGSGFLAADESGQSSVIYTAYSDGTTGETRIESDGSTLSVTETRSSGISAVTQLKDLTGESENGGFSLETVSSSGRSVSLTTEELAECSRIHLTYSHGEVSQEILEKDEFFGTVYRYRVLYRDGRTEETTLLDETEGMFLLMEMLGHMADYSDASWYIQ